MVKIDVKIKKTKDEQYSIITTEYFNKEEMFERLKLMESMRNSVLTNMTRIKTQNKRIPAIVKEVKKEITDTKFQLPQLKERAKEMLELINVIRTSVEGDKIIQKKIKEMDDKKLKPTEKISDSIKIKKVKKIK